MALRGGIVAVAVSVALAGCGAASADGSQLSVQPLGALLTLDQLADPGFTTYSPAHAETALEVAGTAAGAAALSRDLLQAAAAVRYTRQDEFATANGPLDVTATLERFGSADGAATAFTADVTSLDAVKGATAVSTGPLGDAAHATSIVKALPNGLLAVQITLEWRDANVIAVLVLRGRDGGTTLQDALTLAAAQQADLFPGGSPAA